MFATANKFLSHIREKITDTELTDFMEVHKKHYSVQMMCDVLAVPRSTYYHSLQKTESTRERENQAITKKIIQIHQESKERYGSPKIHRTLQKVGSL